MSTQTRRGIDPLTLYRADGDCWVWTGYLDPAGYGRFGRKLAHRLFYERHVGPVPEGKELDHLCRRPACVRPAHLEPVSHTTNVQRGAAGRVNGERQRAKTACLRGHQFTPENTRIDGRGHRSCRACARLLHTQYYHENLERSRSRGRDRWRARKS